MSRSKGKKVRQIASVRQQYRKNLGEQTRSPMSESREQRGKASPNRTQISKPKPAKERRKGKYLGEERIKGG